MARALSYCRVRKKDFRLRFECQSCILQFMTECIHQELVLVGGQGKKVRCRHCHLTIDEEELGEGYCPECREVNGVQRRDFEELESEEDGMVQYRCEGCGDLIEVG